MIKYVVEDVRKVDDLLEEYLNEKCVKGFKLVSLNIVSGGTFFDDRYQPPRYKLIWSVEDEVAND